MHNHRTKWEIVNRYIELPKGNRNVLPAELPSGNLT